MVDKGGDRRSIFDAELLRALLSRLETTDVGELNILCGTSRVYVRRTSQQHWVPGPLASRQLIDRHAVPVNAPLAGVYYSRPEPTSSPFVVSGGLVEAGQTVAVIETMKLFNEVVSEVSGKVTSLVAQDGDMVEAGQPIMFIEPGEHAEHAPPHGLL